MSVSGSTASGGDSVKSSASSTTWSPTMTTRSTQLAAVTVLSTKPSAVAYIVPAGMVTIVKSAHVMIHNAAGDTVRVSVITAGLTVLDLVAVTSTTPIHDEWNGWMVLEAGDRLDVFAQLGRADFLISGAELAVS